MMLVVGATGIVGNTTVPQLTVRGVPVRALVRSNVASGRPLEQLAYYSRTWRAGEVEVAALKVDPRHRETV